MDFDKILEEIGGWNRYQIYTYVIIGIAGLHPGMHNLAAVFTAGVPDHICYVAAAPQKDFQEISRDVQRFSSPLITLRDGTVTRDSCRIYNLNYSLVTDWDIGGNKTYNRTGEELIDCQKWNYDPSIYKTSIVSRWNLVCDEAWKRATAQSIYMFGFMVGAIGFGSLSDRIGRKPTFLICIILLVVTGTAAAFAPEYWTFVVLRWASGCAAAGSFTGGFVLTMEQIDIHHRLFPGLCYQGWFALGYMILPGIAYFVREYVKLQLIISVPPIIFLSYYWLMDESPRWLISQGRYKEAEVIIRKIARINKKPVPEDLLKIKDEESNKTNDSSNEKKYTILDLLRPPRMRVRALNTFFNWFVNSMVFYGLSFSVSNLGGSTHLNLAISGLMEFPAYCISVVMLSRIGRRWTLMIIMVFGGIACCCMLAIPKGMIAASITLSMLGKLAISGSFSTIYVFSAELFPTVIRNTAVGSGSMHARIGGIVAPLVAELGHLVWGPLPTIIFSVTAIIAGLLALLLPETLHQHLPETIEDGERFGSKGYVQYIHDKENNHEGTGDTEMQENKA